MSYSQPPENPYGAPGPHGGPVPQKTSVMAIIALVTGIIGLIPCFWGCFVFSIASTILGFLGKKEIRESNGAKKGAGMAQAGFIMGLIGIAIGVLWWVLVTADVINFDYYSDFD